MTRDDIIRMAKEANGEPAYDDGVDWVWSELERFAKMVAEHEREECVKVVKEWLHGEWHNQGVVAALMIRERGAP
jgi:hypothetical protein